MTGSPFCLCRTAVSCGECVLISMHKVAGCWWARGAVCLGNWLMVPVMRLTGWAAIALSRSFSLAFRDGDHCLW